MAFTVNFQHFGWSDRAVEIRTDEHSDPEQNPIIATVEISPGIPHTETNETHGYFWKRLSPDKMNDFDHVPFEKDKVVTVTVSSSAS